MAEASVYDELRSAASGDVIATSELLDRTFTIISHEQITTGFKDKNDNPKVTNIAVIKFEGEDEEIRAWLGGVQLNRQLHTMSAKGHLPLRVVLRRNPGPNEPYYLDDPSAGAYKTADKILGDPLGEFRDGGKLDAAAFIQWWHDRGYTTEELTSIIGGNKPSELEKWFAVEGRELQTLVKAAHDLRFAPDLADEEAEDLPFE